MVHPHVADNRHLAGPVRRAGDGPARKAVGRDGDGGQRVRKLLVKVTVERSVGPVQVVMSAEDTVADLINAVVELYKREKRRPLMSEIGDPTCFELHYSPFNLECLKMEEKLVNLESRNFFLCRKPNAKSMLTCYDDQVKKAENSAFPLTNLMDFLL
uniref:DUF7054 domain-containing protein n=1 Tax=Opuntia streptacantha TaxID=393608 RepID=A0A7C8YYV7_OPUST